MLLIYCPILHPLVHFGTTYFNNPYMVDALIKSKSIWDALPKPNIKGDQGIIGDLWDAGYSDVDIILDTHFFIEC